MSKKYSSRAEDGVYTKAWVRVLLKFLSRCQGIHHKTVRVQRILSNKLTTLPLFSRANTIDNVLVKSGIVTTVCLTENRFSYLFVGEEEQGAIFSCVLHFLQKHRKYGENTPRNLQSRFRFSQPIWRENW